MRIKKYLKLFVKTAVKRNSVSIFSMTIKATAQQLIIIFACLV